MTAEKVIELLGLEPLPHEGGYFSVAFRSALEVSFEKNKRSATSSIYYLVTPESFSALHRLSSDEIFHFYLGDPVEMVQITERGDLNRKVLGPDIGAGQKLQVAVPAGIWQGTKLVTPGKWALLGCTVSPGYDARDFYIENRDELINRFPTHRLVIEQYTHA